MRLRFRKRASWRASLVVISIILLSGVSVFAEEPSIEERLLRMEQDMKNLRERNEELQQEILSLQERLKERDAEDVASVTEAETAVSPPLAQVEVTPFDVGYQNGFYLSGDDFSLQIGGRITGRLTIFESDTPLDDQFSIKRARLETEATLLDNYLLRLTTEFADATRPTDSYSTRLKDGYIEINYWPEARLRIGQFKVPFSWESLQSHKYLDFADRSLAVTNMSTSRDIGLMLFGNHEDKFLLYQLALINGSGDNKPDNNSAKDIAARVAVMPFTDSDDSLLSPLLLGVSGTFGDQNTDLESTTFRTTGGTEFVDFAPDTVLEGDRTRLGTEFIWPLGPASVKSEFMWMWWQDIENAGVEEDVSFDGWYISGTYLLTGEKKTLGRVVPLKPFDPTKRTWGAWEVAARYSIFESDDDLFDSGLATGSEKASAFTIGLNWYLNPYMRMIVDFEHTDFEDDFFFDDVEVDEEDVLFLQWQLEF